MSTWQVQAAKQRFSEVLREAEAGEPQFITRHGREVAVILDIADYRASHDVKPDFKEAIEALPLGQDDLDLMTLIGPRPIEEARRSWLEAEDE